MKRRLGALLAVVLVLTMFSSSALAAGTTLTVKTPETIPRAGEEFTVTVDISGNTGLRAIQFTLEFDHDFMRCKSAKISENFSGMISRTNPSADSGAIVASANSEVMNGDGTVATFVFVAEKALSALNFSLRDIVMVDSERNRIALAEETAQQPESGNETNPNNTGHESTTTPSTPSGGGTTTPATQETPTETASDTPTDTPAETAAAPFPDAVGHWGEEWIVKAAERGLFQGDDKGNFRPNDNISRGDYVLVLWRMAGSPEPENAAPFADVPANAYYAKAVAWAYEKGYVNGKGDGFAPKDSLTRQEAMKILFGCAGGVSGGEVMYYGIYETGFADSGEIASWAKPAMYWAYYKTIISGTGANKLSPTAVATRAQLAKILVGYQDMQIKEGTT